MKFMIICLMFLLLLPSIGNLPALGIQAASGGEWSTLAPMPTARQEISTAVLNGKVFVIAGFNSAGNSTNTVEVYDPLTNTWSSAAPLPIITNHNAAAVAAGTLYAFGGTSNRVFAYDPRRNTWSDVAPMRYMHGNTPAVAVIKDLIYVAGGTGPGMNGNEVEVYNPITNTWTTLAPMNVPRNHTAGGAINGKFYVVGGRGSPSAASALEVYDPQTNAWTMLRPMPTGRSGIAAGVVSDRLYVFGGEIPRLFGEVEVYNPADNSWQMLPPMLNPRHGIFASVINNAIYIPAGATQQGFGATNVNDVFIVEQPAFNPIDDSQFFVRQQYLDFLNRDPEPEGFNAWVGVLNRCPNINNDPNCDRIEVSAAFFRSPEFQFKGYFVYRFYRVSLGRLPFYAEIIPDMIRVTGATGDEVIAKRRAFSEAWVGRQDFKSAYDSLTNAAFVDTLLGRYSLTSITTPDPANPEGTAKVTLSHNDLVNRLESRQLTRAQVLRAIVESQEVDRAEYNGAFVAMQYYGYLRRDPETDGYNAWLQVINRGDSYRVMVDGFMNSIEYRRRFGRP